MRDVVGRLDGWWQKGETAALATVVGTLQLRTASARGVDAGRARR